MLAPVFHAWERRLAAATPDRVVRPFEWGLDWIPDGAPPDATPIDRFQAFADTILADSDAFFSPPPTRDFEVTGDVVRFPSAYTTPHAANNTVVTRYFPGRPAKDGSRVTRAVVVLPQWNADREGHVGLCRLLARFGMSALRLTLPYHDDRMPSELHRADYIVSANVGRTLQVNRQAVLDARRAIDWLESQGYERIGILGTSLGSCLSMLTAAHDPRIRAAALNHVSVYFADVVWEGLSTAHVRQGLDSHVGVELLRQLWMPISPYAYVERMRRVRTLLVYAKYDLTFPERLSKELIRAFRDRHIAHDTAVLPCGHYSTGVTPFKYLDGFYLTKFLRANL